MMNCYFTAALKKTFLLSLTVLCLVQCSPEEEIAPSIPAASTSLSTPTEESTFSLNISGIHTFAEGQADCKTCKFIVPANTVLIDGQKLGLKPGDVVCLDDAIKYGS